MDSAKPDLINRLSELKRWQIVALGGVALAAALVVVTFVAHLCYGAFPEYFGWVAGGHLLAAGAAWWFVPKPFIEAYQLSRYKKEIQDMLDLLAAYWDDAAEEEAK